jgi:PKD repeat protein
MARVRRTVACALATAAALVVAAPASAQTVWAVGDGGVPENTDDQLAAYIVNEGAFDRFLYLGDVYETGTAQEFAQNYHTSFGRFKDKSSPTPGNHEWGNRATGYDPYWGSLAPQTNGGHYYSFDLGDWHFVSLNSEEAIDVNSAQIAWLKQDLARYKGTCTIAYMHRPRHTATSGISERTTFQPAWDALKGHAVALLSGHDHNYERFHPIDGLVQFIVGTGGRFRYDVNEADTRLAASNDANFGALRLRLERGRAAYEFMTTADTQLDSGSLTCTPHDAPPTAAFNWTPAAPVAGQEVTFTSTSSDPDGALTAIDWDLDNDGQYDDAQGATAKRTFAAPGTYQVGLRVTDGQGDSATDARSVTVGAPPNQPPDAAFEYTPAAPVAEQEVAFSSTSSDPDGELVAWAWDLDGDGQYDDAQGSSAKRTFPAAGSYPVGLRVEDERGGSDTATRQVDVGAAPVREPPPRQPPPDQQPPPDEQPPPDQQQPPGEQQPPRTEQPPTTEQPPRTERPPPELVPAPPPALPSRVTVSSPRHGAVHSRRLRTLWGDAAGAVGPVSVTLVRRGRRCARFDGRAFVRASCRTRVGVAVDAASQWLVSLPSSLRLAPATYRLTVRLTGGDGVTRLAGTTFRIR